MGRRRRRRPRGRVGDRRVGAGVGFDQSVHSGSFPVSRYQYTRIAEYMCPGSSTIPVGSSVLPLAPWTYKILFQGVAVTPVYDQVGLDITMSHCTIHG